MERYLISLAKACQQQEIKLLIMYENEPSSAEFISGIKTNGAQLLNLKMKKRLNLSYLTNLYHIIKHNQVDIVHSYFSPTCHVVSMVGKWAGVKTVKTAGNMPLHSHLALRDRLSWLLRKKVSFKQYLPTIFLDRLICISQSVKKEFESFGINEKKIRVIHLGIDIQEFDPSRIDNHDMVDEFHITKDEVIIGTVGRLEKQKNLDFLIRVFASVCKERANIKLIMVGDGSLKNHLISLCKTLGVESRVIFAGRRNDVPAILKAIDIFMFPSLFEGMGNALLEAMAMQKVCITSDIDVFKEVIRQGDNGYFCRLDNEEDFKEKVLGLLENKEKRISIGIQARKTILEQFSIDKRVQSTIDVYRELVHESSSA